jgi:S-formylglutathione hydrolase FrmB
MALMHVEFRAERLQKQSSMDVIVPEQGDGPFPVLYLLHGLSDNHTIWQRRTSIERYVEGRGLIVVMPDGHRSFYINDPRESGCAYEDHIAEDVVGFVDRLLPTHPSREARAIAGLSMGGYGAIMLSLRHPELFAVGCSHSGALAFASDRAESRHDLAEISRGVDPGAYDCFQLAASRADQPNRPALRFDCGTDDFLLEHNRLFRDHLRQVGYPHEYAEHPGGHNWDYWDEHIRQSLDFVAANLPRMTE